MKEYIENLEDGDIIYFKALSTVGELECVDDITEFKINNKQQNITIGDYYIPVIKTITVTVSEVV